MNFAATGGFMGQIAENAVGAEANWPYTLPSRGDSSEMRRPFGERCI